MCGLTDIMEGGGGNGGPHSMNPYLNPKLRHNNNTMHPSPLLSTHLHPTTTIPDSRCCLCYQRVILLSVTIAHVSQCCWFNVETLHSPPVRGMLQPSLQSCIYHFLPTQASCLKRIFYAIKIVLSNLTEPVCFGGALACFPHLPLRCRCVLYRR